MIKNNLQFNYNNLQLHKFVIILKKSTVKHFHAHICMKTNLYLRILAEKHSTMAMKSIFIPSKNWDMTLSDTEDLYSLYINNVLHYSISNSIRTLNYKKKELASIKSMDGPGKPKYQMPFRNKYCIDLVYDMKQPMLKFNLKGL